MDNGTEDGIHVDVVHGNRERKDSNSERKTVRFDPEPKVVFLELEEVYDPTPGPACLVRQRVMDYQIELLNRSNAKPPLPPRNRVDPLVALARILEQPLPPTPPPSPSIKIIKPTVRPKPCLNGQLTVTSRGVRHYRRDPALIDALAAVGGSQLGNAALPTRFYRALSMNPYVPPKVPKIPKKTKMPPPPPPPLQPKPATLKAAMETVQEEPKPSTSKAAVQVVEPKPSTSKAAMEVAVQEEPKPSTSKAAVQVAVQVEPKLSTPKAVVQVEPKPSTSQAAVQEEPKPSTSKAAVDVALQEEPKPSTSKAAVDMALQEEPKPSTSKAAVDVVIQVEPMANGQTQSDGKQHGENDNASDKKHKGKCKIRNGRCKKCERAAGRQADDNNHDGPGMRCLLFTIQCLGCSTM